MADNDDKGKKGSKAKDAAKHVAEHTAEHVVWHGAAHIAGFSNAAGMMAAGLFGFSDCMPKEEFPTGDKLKAAQEAMKKKYGTNPDGSLKCPWRPASGPGK